MATYNEILYNLDNIYSNGIGSDDSNVSHSQILFWVNYYRAKLIREDLNKGRNLDPQLIQDLGCVPVQCADNTECCDLGLEGETIVRTVNPIPKLLQTESRITLTFVGTVDKKVSFNFTSEAKARWAGHSKYTSKSPRAFMRSNNGHLYFMNAPQGIELVNIRGIFEDPTDAEKYTSCTGEPCFTRDMEYPISAHMLPIINSLIIQNEFRIIESTPTDTNNNAEDDAGQQ